METEQRDKGGKNKAKNKGKANNNRKTNADSEAD